MSTFGIIGIVISIRTDRIWFLFDVFARFLVRCDVIVCRSVPIRVITFTSDCRIISTSVSKRVRWRRSPNWWFCALFWFWWRIPLCATMNGRSRRWSSLWREFRRALMCIRIQNERPSFYRIYAFKNHSIKFYSPELSLHHFPLLRVSNDREFR